MIEQLQFSFPSWIMITMTMLMMQIVLTMRRKMEVPAAVLIEDPEGLSDVLLLVLIVHLVEILKILQIVKIRIYRLKLEKTRDVYQF